MNGHEIIFFISFWIYILLIIGMVLAFRAYRIHKLGKDAERNWGLSRLFRRDDAPLKEIAARMDKLEQRMANIETIVLESEKHRDFERSL